VPIRAFSSKWISAVLGAAVASLACAVVGMFVARAHLLEASGWVRHTSEVELSIAACRIHAREAQLNVPERRALLAEAGDDAERIAGLTADNPTQQTRVKALLPLLRAFTGDPTDSVRIDQILRELAAVEGSLMDIRMAMLKRTTRSGWIVISAGAALTILFVVFVLGALYRQSLALTRAEINLRREGALLESVFDSMVDGIMAITPERTFLHVNRAARRLLGDSFPTDSFPKDWRPNIECIYEDGTAMKPEDGALARAIVGKSTDNLVYRARLANSPDFAGTWISATARPVRDPDGTVVAGVVALRDISEQKRQQDQLRAMSMSDEMTGLHNRRGFLMLAEQHARMAQRQRTPFAIVFADLNGLKTINDALGHDAGDQCIRSVADVLRRTFRDSDIIARLGGDEFVALLVNTDSAMRDTIAERLREGLARHNLHETPARHLSLSIGIAFFDPESPLPIAELMVEADRLMYAEKRGHRSARGPAEAPQAR
jgi:diguanylate cyclase (GGDEF)-like protein